MKHLIIFFAHPLTASSAVYFVRGLRRAVQLIPLAGERKKYWFKGLGMGTLALLLALSSPQTAHAQNCANPLTQLDMNECAALDYERADAALNAAWGPSMAFAKKLGQGDALRKVQRQWLAYRDAACRLHMSPYDGGSIQPLIYSTCLTDLTRARTRMLNEFKEY